MTLSLNPSSQPLYHFIVMCSSNFHKLKKWWKWVPNKCILTLHAHNDCNISSKSVQTVITILSTIMPPLTCDNYKAKKCILGHIWAHRDRDPLTPKSDAFILVPQSISGECLVKFYQKILSRTRYLANNVCLRLVHAQKLWKHKHAMPPTTMLVKA